MALSVTGTAEVKGGPVTGMFDSPYLAISLANQTQLGFTANAKTYLYAQGSNVSSFLSTPFYTNLGPEESPATLDHCGAWLHAAVPDPENASVVYGFYHEEWKCDYANNFFTNKSIAAAISYDGGWNFQRIAPDPQNVIIQAANYTSEHQTGEGDHGVVVLGDDLLLFFLEWDGEGGTTISVAKSPFSSRGKPGSWMKWYNGSFSSPGIGGNCSLLHGIAGTAVYARPIGDLLSVGARGFDTSVGIMSSTDGIHWTLLDSAQAPLTNYVASSWSRGPGVPELRGYPSLSGRVLDHASIRDEAFLWVTYWPVGSVERYLVRRPVTLLATTTPEPSFGLWALAEFHDASHNNTIDSTTPLPLLSTVWENTSLIIPSKALLLTTNTSSSPTCTSSLFQCDVPRHDGSNDTRVTVTGECTKMGGVWERHIGWVWAPDAPLSCDIQPTLTATLQHPSPALPTPPTTFTFHTTKLFRCPSTDTTLQLNTPSCPNAVLLGAAYAPDPSTRQALAARSGL